MAIDLSCPSLLSSTNLIVEDDALVILEQDRANDRVRRVFFDRMDMVLVWRTLPWVRMLIMFLLFGVPLISLLIWAPDDQVKWIVGGGLGAIFLFVEFRYLYNRKTHILIRREDAEKSFSVIVRPGKLRKFLRRLREAAEACQARHHAEEEKGSTEATD